METFPKPISCLGMEKLNPTQQKHTLTNQKKCTTTQKNTSRIWANAKRDGRPAEHRWRPLFNASKFAWCSLLDCHAVMLQRRETRWNLHRCPKLTKRSQPLPLVGQSSPYCEDIWGKYCCLTGFFRLSIHHVWKYGRHPMCGHWD